MGGEYEDVELEKRQRYMETGYQRGVTGRQPIRPGKALVEKRVQKGPPGGFQ